MTIDAIGMCDEEREVSSSNEFADRTCYRVSSALFSALDKVGLWFGRLVAPLDPEKFDNEASKIKEIGIRTLMIFGTVFSLCFAGIYLAVLAAAIGAGSLIFRALGTAFQQNGYTYVSTTAPQTFWVNQKLKIMSWAISAHSGSGDYANGVIHWNSRLDRIVRDIQQQKADVVILQEVFDTACMEALVEKLGKEYPHFYYHLGANIFGDSSGSVVIAKCAIDSFTHADFKDNDYKIHRGFEILEVKAHPEDEAPSARIVCAQLTPEKEKQAEQFSEIARALQEREKDLPTFFVGSAFESPSLYPSDRSHQPTYSGELANQWISQEKVTEELRNIIALFKRMVGIPAVEKGVKWLDFSLVPGFDPDYSTKTARSPSHGLVAEFKIVKGLTS